MERFWPLHFCYTWYTLSRSFSSVSVNLDILLAIATLSTLIKRYQVIIKLCFSPYQLTCAYSLQLQYLFTFIKYYQVIIKYGRFAWCYRKSLYCLFPLFVVGTLSKCFSTRICFVQCMSNVHKQYDTASLTSPQHTYPLACFYLPYFRAYLVEKCQLMAYNIEIDGV